MAKLYFTKEQVENAVMNSKSTKEFLIYLGMKVNNGNYRKAEDICRSYDLILPKHDSKTNFGNLKSFVKLSDEEYFADGVLRGGQKIRTRLVKDHGIPDECLECGQLPIWNGKPLTLEVDHIDGNRFNNKLDNLRILCGHCHSQTPTYSNNRGLSTYTYCACGVRIDKKSKNCRDCYKKQPPKKLPMEKSKPIKVPKTDYPPIQELLKEISDSSFVAVGKRLGVSDNAVRKYIERAAGKDAVPKGYAKKPKPAPLTEGRKFLNEANVHDVIADIEKPGNSIKAFAATIHVDVKYLRSWLTENLGHTYTAPRNKQTLNPNQGKVEYPPVEDLLTSMANNGSERTAKSLGVTSKALERYLRKHLPKDAFPLLRSGFLERYKA